MLSVAEEKGVLAFFQVEMLPVNCKEKSEMKKNDRERTSIELRHPGTRFG